MKKKLITSALSIIMSVMLIGCGNNAGTNDNKGTDSNEKLNITVSIYPLQEFTEKITGDKANVTCMVPNNMEPHDYEPKTKDLETATKSNLFIYNGLGMEAWADKVIDMLGNQDVIVLNASDNIDVRKEGDIVDPHSWLSLIQAQKEAESIKNAVVKLDEKNKDYYEENYNNFKKELDDLYQEYKPKFESLSSKDFITGHAAFGYLCRDFNLEQKSVENLFGEGEPTPKQLQDLVNFCKENNIKTIFSESLASPKVSETLANEVNGVVVPIYTLESNEDDKSYIEAMRYDLEQIYNCLSNEEKSETNK